MLPEVHPRAWKLEFGICFEGTSGESSTVKLADIARCLIPGSNGAVFSYGWKEALRGRFRHHGKAVRRAMQQVKWV